MAEISQKLAETSQVKEESTILMDMEDIVEAFKLKKGFGLTEDFYAPGAPASAQIERIAQRFEITPLQAALFSALVSLSNHTIDDTDISRAFQCSDIRIMQAFPELEALSRNGLLVIEEYRGQFLYSIPIKVRSAIRHNEVYHAPSKSFESEEALLEFLFDQYVEFEDEQISPESLCSDLRDVFRLNPDSHIVKAIQALNLEKESYRHFMALVAACHAISGTGCGPSFLFKSECTRHGRRRVEKDIDLSTGELFKDGLITVPRQQPMSHISFRLTDSGARTLVPGFTAEKAPKSDDSLLTMPESIAAKSMFYNKEEQRMVSELTSLLDEKNFNDIQKRLSENGMRQGFACLLYGGPGTGKTETVLQLSRSTGRPIMMVDVSEIRDRFVGESEKRVKGIFEAYRRICSDNSINPILFFNEADAIFGKRIDTRNSVDKMENAMQNILLQELESFDGILIATTNLSDNLDPAFERRFIYKIRFESPNIQARTDMWKSMLGFLGDEDSAALAKEFPFSGGQIENIARKILVGSILHGDKAKSLESVKEYCHEELLKSSSESSERKKIGF